MNKKSIKASEALTFWKSGFPSVSFYFFAKGFEGTPREFLDEIGLRAYREAHVAEAREDFVFVCQKDDWTGLIENWGMRLQFSKEIQRHMKAMGGRLCSISAWVGDCDHTFGFRYFEVGRLRRVLEEGDPTRGDPRVLRNSGDILGFESCFESFSDESERLPFVASKLGVPLNLSRSEITPFVQKGTLSKLGALTDKIFRRRLRSSA
jgi:hypothetical protein